MFVSSFAFVVAISLVAHVNGAESDVLDLGDNDFNTRITETDTTLVMFYAPWCGKWN